MKGKTIVPSTPVIDKAAIVERIRRVRTEAKTALHAGWAEGGREVLLGRVPRARPAPKVPALGLVRMIRGFRNPAAPTTASVHNSRSAAAAAPRNPPARHGN